MADKVRIGYFLEDSGHEEFILGLVERIALDAGFNTYQLNNDVRNSTGGKGQVLSELKRFLQSVKRTNEISYDLLIIAIDGNCMGVNGKRKEIQEIIKRAVYLGEAICAVPDPHIELWYMADPACFSEATGLNGTPSPPQYKCERNRYKNALLEAFKRCGVKPPLGGIEYGKNFASEMNLYNAGQACPSLATFIAETRANIIKVLQ